MKNPPGSPAVVSNAAISTTSVQFFLKLTILGAAVLSFGAFVAPLRVWENLYLASLYLLTLALGASVFLALAYVTGAGWHTAFRRVPESMARLIPVAGLFVLVALSLNLRRFGWHAHHPEHPGTFWFKQEWLNPQILLIRSVIYITIWSLFSRLLILRSRRQDLTGHPKILIGSIRISALYLALFAISFSLAMIDWIMSLDPMWFSTIWGIYQFAGMFQATLAAIVLFCILLSSRNQPLERAFNTEHLHDLGKLLVGFSCFWMYIWFCQYMLIWYSNIPEETSYYVTRTRGPWGPVVVASLMMNGIIPFFALLSRPSKRSREIMSRIALLVLAGRWIDLYIMIGPTNTPSGPQFGLWEVATLGCLIGLGGISVLRSFRCGQPVPSKDPYLAESLHYHAS